MPFPGTIYTAHVNDGVTILPTPDDPPGEECGIGMKRCRGTCIDASTACVDAGGDVGVNVNVPTKILIAAVAITALTTGAFGFWASRKYGGRR